MPEYIEREAFIKRLENEADRSSDIINLLILNGIANIVRDENIAPTADVAEVRHGEWKPCFEDWRKQIEGDECSVCGFQHYGTTIRDYHYCPNCGADMRGENK